MRSLVDVADEDKVFEMKMSGCTLAWDFFHGDKKKEIPLLFRYLEVCTARTARTARTACGWTIFYTCNTPCASSARSTVSCRSLSACTPARY